MYRQAYCALVLLLVSVYSTSAALEVKTVAQESPPKYIYENGRMSGLCVDIIKAVEEIEPTLKFTGYDQFAPLARIVHGLEVGNYDAFFCLANTPERMQTLNLIDVPLYTVNEVIVTRADDVVDIKSLDDIRRLAGENPLLVLRGSTQAQYLEKQPGLFVDQGNSHKENLTKLAAKRGRFLYGNESSLVNVLEKEGAAGRQFKVLPTPLRVEARYAFLSKKASPTMVDKVRHALEKLSKRGELRRIQARYRLE